MQQTDIVDVIVDVLKTELVRTDSDGDKLVRYEDLTNYILKIPLPTTPTQIGYSLVDELLGGDGDIPAILINKIYQHLLLMGVDVNKLEYLEDTQKYYNGDVPDGYENIPDKRLIVPVRIILLIQILDHRIFDGCTFE